MHCSLCLCRRAPAHLLPQDTAPPRSVARCRRPAKGPSMPVRWRRAASLSRRSKAASRFGSRRTERKCSSAGGRRGRRLRPAIFDPALAKVTELHDMRPSDSVCAVRWTRKGSYLAIATCLEMSRNGPCVVHLSSIRGRLLGWRRHGHVAGASWRSR